MQAVWLVTLLLILRLSATAQGTALTPGSQLLFQNTKTKLTAEEKNSIFRQLGFLVSADGKQFIADKEAADFPFHAQVYPTDLNKDGREEIFVLFGNTYTSGITGSSISLFIANARGVYQTQLGFPGTLPHALATPGNKYPDLIIGGPGFEYPVWKWKTGAYVYSRQIRENELVKIKTESIEALSKKYLAALN